MIYDRIFEEISIDELNDLLVTAENTDGLREALLNDFLRCANYSTPEQWNKAVRLCECLAIIGWGDHEGVEAHAGKYINGYPNTFFSNINNEVRYLDAVWSRREGGIVIDQDRSSLNSMPNRQIVPVICENVKLHSQRNWLPKCPVQIVRTLENCYAGSRQVMDSIRDDLNPSLLKKMRPHLYGRTLNRVLINCAMSFNDGPHCKTNYVIADEGLKLNKSEYYGQLLTMYTEKMIERDGLYLRPRYDIGPFRKNTGIIHATIVFEKEFSEKPATEQKRLMSQYFLTTVERITDRQKRTDYNFKLMMEDFSSVLNEWSACDY